MEPGQLLQNRYRIDREIGRGEFGVVYLAEDVQTASPVAVKVLLPWAKRNEQLRHRLKREAKLAGMLKSEFAVRIQELIETDEQDLAIVMEFLDGPSLHEVLAKERVLAPDRVARLATQVLTALAEAHALGVIHRDLKPGNIQLIRGADGQEQVKVLDFGIAKLGGSGNSSDTAKLTQQGGTLGTPVYMSPEQCRGEELTPASDLYSLGVVLYELLTSRVPFDDDNPVRILMMHNDQPPPPLPPTIASTRIGQAVMRALEKDPARRFASAAQFLETLGAPAPKAPAPSPKQWTAQVKDPSEQKPKKPKQPTSFLAILKRNWIPFAVAALIGAAAAGYFLE
jgi:serine/threonine protein kinase